MMTSQNEPLLIDAKQVASLLGISRTLFYTMHSSGQLGPMPVKLGRRSLWRPDELYKWVQAGCPPRDQWVKKCHL